MTAGERIRSERIYRSITQREMARKSGVSEGTIRKLEKTDYNGESGNLHSIAGVSAVLGVRIEWLFFGIGKKEMVIRQQTGTVGQRIRKRRRELKMSAEVMEERTGYSLGTLCEYERDVCEPGIMAAQCICEALGMTLEQLVGWEPMEVKTE